MTAHLYFDDDGDPQRPLRVRLVTRHPGRDGCELPVPSGCQTMLELMQATGRIIEVDLRLRPVPPSRRPIFLERLQQDMVAGAIDVLLVDALADLTRNPKEARGLIKQAVRHGIRLLIADERLDTRSGMLAVAVAGADMDAHWNGFDMLVHAYQESDREKTAERIRRTLLAKFQTGKLPPPLIAGYEATAHPQTEQDVWAAPKATPVVMSVARRLKAGASDAAVARYLNDIGFATGSRCRKAQWDARMIRRWITSPLIGGVHVHGQWRRMVDPRTGRVRQVKAAPHEVHTRDCPHLRHLPREEHEALVRWLEQRR